MKLKLLMLQSAGHLFNITAILLPANTTLYNTAQLYAQLAAALFDANVAGEMHVAASCVKQLRLQSGSCCVPWAARGRGRSDHENRNSTALTSALDLCRLVCEV